MLNNFIRKKFPHGIKIKYQTPQKLDTTQEGTNFPQIYDPPQNSRLQRGKKQQVSKRKSTNTGS